MMHSSASVRSVRLLLIFFFALASLYYISRSYQRIPIPPTADSFTPGGKQPAKPASQFPLPGDGQPIHGHGQPLQPGETPQTGKTKAAFVTLIRNHEIWDIARSIRQIEDRFNRNYHYPWVFLNDVPFTDEFIQVTSALTSGNAQYGMSSETLFLVELFSFVKADCRVALIVALVPKEHWGVPEWIDEEKAKKAREDMQQRNIIYGGSLPYRHMCRFQSGFFWRQPVLDEYDWYWRVVYPHPIPGPSNLEFPEPLNL
jgi:alpha 1,2-mannosyltransferase